MASATDNFNRANGAPGANWTGSVGDDLTITSNQIGGVTVGVNNSMYYNALTPTAAQYALCTIAVTASGQYTGATVRGNATDWVCMDANGGTSWQIEWYNGGAFTLIGSAYSTSPATNDIGKITANGSAFEGFVNGVSRITGSNGSAPATGSGGLYIYGTSGRADNFEVGDLTSATFEQEGFRFGEDDGNEAAHTWTDAQDTNIITAANTAKLLRMLVNTSADTASSAFTLRQQKNGSGGYTAVGVGATSVGTTPLIEAADSTESGSNTASTSWALSTPNASTGDLLIFCLSWDDSTDTTDVTEPAGKASETLLEVNATPATDAGTETRCKVWYCIAAGSWTAGTITFTPSASEQWTGACIRVPAGEFDATTPIGASDTEGSTVDGTNVQHGAFTAGASDGGGKLCIWTSADTDPQTVAANYTQVCNTDRGAVSGGFFHRNAAVTNSESIGAGTVSTIASDSWCSVAFVVRAPIVTNDVYVETSGNITAGGEATTARLNAPSGKTTSDFVTGRRWDNENGSDSTDITTDDYSEFEWSLKVRSGLSGGDYFDFRVYAGSNALDTYTLTPRWTIGVQLYWRLPKSLNQAMERSAL